MKGYTMLLGVMAIALIFIFGYKIFYTGVAEHTAEAITEVNEIVNEINELEKHGISAEANNAIEEDATETAPTAAPATAAPLEDTLLVEEKDNTLLIIFMVLAAIVAMYALHCWKVRGTGNSAPGPISGLVNAMTLFILHAIKAEYVEDNENCQYTEIIPQDDSPIKN